MGSDDITSILERLESLEKVTRRIENALLGKDPYTNPADGLLHEHSACRGNVSGMEKRLATLERQVLELGNYKRTVMAYVVAAASIIGIVWELFTHFKGP